MKAIKQTTKKQGKGNTERKRKHGQGSKEKDARKRKQGKGSKEKQGKRKQESKERERKDKEIITQPQKSTLIYRRTGFTKSTEAQ